MCLVSATLSDLEKLFGVLEGTILVGMYDISAALDGLEESFVVLEPPLLESRGIILGALGSILVA